LVDPVRFGRGIRALRRRRGWRQLDLAHAARVSRTTIARVELGNAPRVTIDALARIAFALSARLDVRLTWNGELLDRLLDQAHASLAGATAEQLGRAGWEIAPEVSFNVFGERGSIDLLAFRRSSGHLLVVEVKSVLPDLQAMLVSLDRKARLAPRLAAERGWQPTNVSRLLVLPADRTARRRVNAHDAVLGAALPARTVEMKRWIRHPHEPVSGLLFVSDVHEADARHRIRARRERFVPDSRTDAPSRGHVSRSA
jgi:transcriptional regulator with XRE-family HTH domain